MPRNPRDSYYHKARKEGYRSRAAYKLKQMDQRFNIIHRDDDVIDLGAAPGGWLQVARELTTGTVLGVDLQSIQPLEDVQTIRSDITQDSAVDKIKEIMDGADVVLCDAAPNLSGNWSYDHGRSMDIAQHALKIALNILNPGGRLVVKVFQGDMYPGFIREMEQHFSYVKSYTPKASRKQSAEIYVIAKNPLHNL